MIELDSYFDDELSEEQQAEFAAWLSADASHRREFAIRASEHLLLRDALLGQTDNGDVSLAEKQRATLPAGRLWIAIRERFHTITALSLILSGIFMALLLLGLAIITVPMGNPFGPVEQRLEFVARVVRTSEASWSENTDIDKGRITDLYVGQRLELLGGWAEIRFEDETSAVLTAPATVVIRAGNRCDLLAGKLTARSGGTKGFTVDTIAASIVDISTEFGVAVDGKATAAEVFAGEVDLHCGAIGKRTGEVRRLKAGEAVRIATSEAGVSIESTEPSLASFARATQLRDADGKPIEDVPVTRGLVLHFAADRGVVIDRELSVIAWRDQLAGDNQTEQSAEQPLAIKRPKWVAEAINGQPVVRFNNSVLVTPKLALGDNRTVFVVARVDGPGQILNFHGKNNFVLEATARSTIGGRYWNSVSSENSGTAEAPSAIGQPVIACYSYDFTKHSTSIVLDGERTAQASADLSAADDSNLYLGAHPHGGVHLRGDVGEVLVYDAVLTEEETLAMTEYLKEKYNFLGASID